MFHPSDGSGDADTREADVAAAEQAIELALVDPVAAHRRAGELIATSRTPEVAAVAHRALGLACRELGDLDAALCHLTTAKQVARDAGLTTRLAQARLSLVPILADRGDIAAALGECEAAADVLVGVDAARLQAHRACVLARAGRFGDAAADFQAAIRALSRARDGRFLAGTYLNRGLSRVYRGELARAESDLRRCRGQAERCGLRRLVAMADAALGFAAQRGGDIPRALRLYEDAERGLVGAGQRATALRLDRAEALLSVGLTAEARNLLAASTTGLERGGFSADLAEAWLLLAQAELADHAPGAAVVTAERARRTFAAQQRAGWALLAEQVGLRAAYAAGERSPRLVEAAREAGDRLARWGWTLAAAQVLVIAGRVAVETGQATTARQAWTAAAALTGTAGPVAARAVFWEATARLRLLDGDRRGAHAALRAGLRVIAGHAASLGAAEMRAHAATRGGDLAELGLRLAVESRRARSVLTWEERRRAVDVRPPAVRPPPDPRLAAQLAELRRVSTELTHAVAAGSGATDPARAVTRLEAAIRSRVQRLPGHGRPASAIDLDRLVVRLEDRALALFFRSADALGAVTVVAGRFRRHDLGRLEPITRAVAALRFAVERLARRHGGAASRRASRQAIRQAGAVVENRLIAPLERAVGGRELILVPVGVLFTVPWAALPSLMEHPLSVVASARAWMRAAAQRSGAGVVLVAGPDLGHAETEIAAIRRHHPTARVLTGNAARAHRVRAAMEGAAIAHIAAHGDFRAGSPLLSSLRLADGPLFGYEIEALAAPPRLVVLSACDAGLAENPGGETLLGLTGTLLSLGTRCVIASVSAVDDAQTATLMADLHRHLASGMSPARALVAARRGEGALGFLCYGAG